MFQSHLCKWQILPILANVEQPVFTRHHELTTRNQIPCARHNLDVIKQYLYFILPMLLQVFLFSPCYFISIYQIWVSVIKCMKHLIERHLIYLPFFLIHTNLPVFVRRVTLQWIQTTVMLLHLLSWWSTVVSFLRTIN